MDGRIHDIPLNGDLLTLEIMTAAASDQFLWHSGDSCANGTMKVFTREGHVVEQVEKELCNHGYLDDS